MRGIWKNNKGNKYRSCKLLALCLMVSVWMSALQAQPICAGVSCKALCGAALKAAGGSSHLKYKSEDAMDFGGFSVSERKKVSSVMYLCDSKEVYSICVAGAKNKGDAAALYKALKKYKSNNVKSDYLSDYSSSEQKVFQNAVCGKQGNYVWYIALSANKSDNKKGQSAIKKKLP